MWPGEIQWNLPPPLAEHLTDTALLYSTTNSFTWVPLMENSIGHGACTPANGRENCKKTTTISRCLIIVSNWLKDNLWRALYGLCATNGIKQDIALMDDWPGQAGYINFLSFFHGKLCSRSSSTPDKLPLDTMTQQLLTETSEGHSYLGRQYKELAIFTDKSWLTMRKGVCVLSVNQHSVCLSPVDTKQDIS